MKVLVTGAAGFIGMNASLRLLSRKEEVVGLDNLNDYYDVRLKQDRLDQLKAYENFRFVKLDIADDAKMKALFKIEKFDHVLHLAAQAGVRYSLQNPRAYVDSNVVGFLNVLEGCRNSDVKNLVYASSSSVYGDNTKIPFSESDQVDHPLSVYAATKKANELMAFTYSHLYGLPSTGLRFFTVYGPWGRPDMALSLFTKAILEGQPINVFNHGQMRRDFTYVDDVVEGIVRVVDLVAKPKFGVVPYRVFNIGNSRPTSLLDFISCLETALGMQAIKNWLPMQSGDVEMTCADNSALLDWAGYVPRTRIEEGVKKFVAWYLDYHHKQLTAAHCRSTATPESDASVAAN